MESTILRTERLRLALPTRADVDAITVAAQDPEVPRWTTVPSPYSRANAEEFVEKATAWWAEGSQFNWAIHLDAEFVGMIGLHHLEPGAGEIGYWIAAPARGLGIVGEAARAVIDFGFAPEGGDFERVEWRAVVGNIASARTARTLGFRYEGVLRLGLGGPRGRSDGWIAALLRTDDRTPQHWPILD